VRKLRLVPASGQSIEITPGPPITLGRDGSVADVVLEDISTSRIHAVITSDDEAWAITDRRSSNGIFVNGRRVARAKLEEGMELRLGAQVFSVALVEDSDDDTATVRIGPREGAPQPRVVVPSAQRVVAAAIAASGGIPERKSRRRAPGSTMRLERAMALLGVTRETSKGEVRERHRRLRADLERWMEREQAIDEKLEYERRIGELDVALALLVPDEEA